MPIINYNIRNECYSGTEFDFQRLVGRKFLGMNHEQNSATRWKDTPSFKVSLTWEGFSITLLVPEERAIPNELKKHINCKLRDWDVRPNHACETVMLLFENGDSRVFLQVWGGIQWNG